MVRIFATALAGLMGLAFGSFLNVCLSRWPAGESVVRPRSHCRNCGRTLAWWENVPLVSWIALRGRCRTCSARISWRYPLVELAVGALWSVEVWRIAGETWHQDMAMEDRANFLVLPLSRMALYWLLVGLAVLDLEHFWLPDWITLPGVALGFLATLLHVKLNSDRVLSFYGAMGIQDRVLLHLAFRWLLGILAAAALMLLIRFVYWLIRRREGLGLGDIKLMAMLAAWLGLPGAMLSFGIGVVLGALAALVLLGLRPKHDQPQTWALTKLPLGTFLCIGGIVSGLWGERIVDAYLRWAGF